jgi:hypothetical protein
LMHLLPALASIPAPASQFCSKSTPLASIIAAFSSPSYTRSVGADPATPLGLVSPATTLGLGGCTCVCYYLPLQGDSPVPQGGGGEQRRQRAPLARMHSKLHQPPTTPCLYLASPAP